MNPAKLKVVELRAELSARGLDSKGNKAVLVERLQEALDKEEGGSESKTPEEEEEEEFLQEQNETIQSEAPEEVKELDSEPPKDDPVEEPEDRQPSPAKIVSPVKEQEPMQQDEYSPDDKEQTENPEHDEPAEVESELKEEKDGMDYEETERQPSPQKPSERHSYHMDDDKKDLPQEGEEKEDFESDIKEEKIDDEEYSKHEMKSENGVKEGYEQDVKQEIKNEEDIKTEREEKKDSHDSKESRKRRRSSRSPSHERSRGGKSYHDHEPEIKDNEVTLSWYDSDLNLTIDDKTFLSATPMSHGGFGYVWAGVRGSHGFTSGSLCYQVKVTSFPDVSHLEDEPNPNVLRVGWSIFETSMQLGEEPFSYGYGGTGKFSVDCKFSNYGKPFGLNDVVTCYLKFTDDEAIISYGVNDEYLGVAYRVPLDELKGRPLAPHILSKNAAFAVNFGQEDVPWAQVEEDYTFLRNVPLEEATPGPRRPEKLSDCEMIMMCGLPAAGKTFWANKYAAEHPEKNYNILGTNSLIDKMKVMGLPRKANYSGRWDVLIEKCTKCLLQLMDIGSHRRRNYILDQTNVYPAAQRRKMRNFEGFTRKAVVIVPTDEEFKSRTEMQAKDEKKDVPESAVLEMKANFSLPDKDMFDEVIYAELPEEEAQVLIQKYAKEANEKGYERKPSHGGFGPPNKRFRGGDFRQRTDFRRDRFGPPGPPSPFRRPDRGGPRGGWGGPRGGPMDRWRDNRNQGYGRPMGGDRPAWRGSSGGPPGGNGRGPRDFDRGGPAHRGGGGYDRNNRGGPRSGGFNNRDFSRDQRGPPGGPRGGLSDKPRTEVGKFAGGAGASTPSSQWGNQWGNQAQGSTGGAQSSANQGAWSQQAQYNNQVWNNYQQQWKGYQQGYNQQGYNQQGYNPSSYNWQQYYNYNQQGGWAPQNSDGSYNYQQNWQNWYAAQSANQTGQTQQPPAAK